jgi:hypothetical protein
MRVQIVVLALFTLVGCTSTPYENVHRHPENKDRIYQVQFENELSLSYPMTSKQRLQVNLLAAYYASAADCEHFHRVEKWSTTLTTPIKSSSVKTLFLSAAMVWVTILPKQSIAMKPFMVTCDSK